MRRAIEARDDGFPFGTGAKVLAYQLSKRKLGFEFVVFERRRLPVFVKFRCFSKSLIASAEEANPRRNCSDISDFSGFPKSGVFP